ncbi:endoplasmic reticulum oxidoreductin-1-like [Nicotiana sylvestris]|uniref:Endoplasmic reticulum oxidoreductin-1-like n=1 Tax=Nicotiana sylvestris TaxID=4096 RepID=A0A1U7YRE7_NICSY|nr:PREDICTED: endoplasmic reticulum oxidoreductin-1-like [Nicotiana sylvestris]
MAKPEIDKKKNTYRIQYAWFIGALIVVLFAVFVSTTKFRTFHPFSSTGKRCNCSQGAGKYSGVVEDCCCDYETVNHLNNEVLHPLLQEIVKTPFFRYFKVKLWCDCPFWPDDGMCRLRDCSVCECPDTEFPEPFKAQSHRLSSSNLVCLEENPEAAVDRTIDSKAFKGWVEVDNPWTNDDETDNAEMTYVNLQLNPERYTGYSGPSARRIWDAIYIENCPKYPSGEICPEKKILYKLISGLHSSISIHIAADYLLDEASNTRGQNLTLMYDRVLQFPDRVNNLYFTFLFVLRAVTKAADYLDQASYDTGNLEDDLKTQSWMKQLVYNPKLQAACPLPFDEVGLWKGQSEPDLLQQIQTQFRNISASMDCIGCEKCRLWGKLQVLGLGTALKILFSVNGPEPLGETLHLQRNEVIALINLLNRLSESVMLVHDMGPSLENVMRTQISTPSDQPSMTGEHTNVQLS